MFLCLKSTFQSQNLYKIDILFEFNTSFYKLHPFSEGIILQAKKDHTQKAKKVLDFIKSNDHFLVSAHVNADGDAIASVLAIGMLLDQLNKKYNHD